MSGARASVLWWSTAALCALAVWTWRTERELTRARDTRGAPYAGAEQCQRCHPDHFESWRRTHHSRMTQRATAEAVLGDFGDAPLEYFGVRGRARQAPDGTLQFEHAPGYGPARSERVVLTIGSRRYQQYVAERDGELVRLPWAWHVEDGRWFHMNAAFLTPDPPADAPLSRGHFERHLARWNDNCIFCHNVAPNPGRTARGFESEVAELGVACEACHGPAEAHATLNADPLRRYRLHLSSQADPSIVNPARLSPERSADVCGRCHGQRLTDDIDAFLREGDPFVPGDDLARYSEPLWRDTTLNGQHGVFAPRFWGDGTPRLTAYEYQGLLQSPCAQRGALTCTDCHAMHAGDPHGQLRPDRPGHALCTGCHQDLRPKAAQGEHARHPAGSEVACVDCHMPRIVYGVMDTHRSHRIESPRPGHDRETDRPDACTLCHLDRSRAWAVQETARLWPGTAPGEPPVEPAPAPAVPDAMRLLFAGDPVGRALAAAAIGRGHVSLAALRARYRTLLLEVMERERYPAVRRLAWRTLGQLEPGPLPAAHGAYRAEAPPAERRTQVARLRSALDAPPLSTAERERVAALRASAPTGEIHIGE